MKARAAERRRRAAELLAEALRTIRGQPAPDYAQFQEIVERALQCIALLAPDGTVLEANAQAVRALGAARDELVGTSVWDAPAWASVPELRHRLRAALSAATRGVTVHQESELPGEAGTTTIDLSFNPVKSAGDQVALVVAEWRDVSDRKRAEAALRESEERFQRIVSIAVDAIISIDDAQRIVLFNQGAEQIFGYTASDMIGKSLEVLLPPELGSIHAKEVRAFGEAKEVARRMGQRRQIFGRRRNGEVFRAEASISKTEIGGRRLYTAVLRDVTERWAAEEEKSELLASAQNARAVAERAVAQRDEMLGIVSHDLRNPLSAIGMCAEVLASDETPADERTRLSETIHESVEWCQRLIADLLDIASIEADKLSIERTPTDPVVAMGRALSLFELSATDRSISLVPAGKEHLPSLNADPERLLQVLANLVGNAIKFTPEGGTVTLSAESSNGAVLFSVADTGIGIPPDQVPHVFERRWRGTAKGTDPGTGLGLAIARGIVEAHGGRIWVESKPGAGSTFQFTIPLDPG
jgi:PAS domain S-box-containing protein